MSATRVALYALLLTVSTLAGCAGVSDAPAADAQATDDAGHDHSTHDHGTMAMGDTTDHAHMHEPYEVQDGDPAPTLRIEVLEDPKMGYNVHLITTDFTFTPEDASTAPVPGEGHAHIYLDGQKLGRVYGEWYYLGGVSPGEHTVKVDLNVNDHSPYSVDGELVQDEAVIDVQEKQPMGHSHAESHAASDLMLVDLSVTKDPKSGYNVHIVYDGFTFTPEAASTAHVDGEGHAHLYVDGAKVTRMYGDWYHISLDEGEHEVSVGLNGNDHVQYTWNGEPVAAAVTVTV